MSPEGGYRIAFRACSAIAMIMQMCDRSKAESIDTLTTVFLDRDGVINEKMPEGEYVRSSGDFRLLPGVPQAIARLNRAKLRVLIVSNQRGIALGLYTTKDVEVIHSALQKMLAVHGAHIDGFYFCPHDREACQCRKPLLGMFEEAQNDFIGISGSQSVMIGDTKSDVEFGRNAGMRTILIHSPKTDPALATASARSLPDSVCSSLSEAIDEILSRIGASSDAQ